MKTLWQYAAGVLLGTTLISGCEQPPPETLQRGYRGTGMELVANPKTLAETVAANTIPEATPQLPAAGPKAKDVYQNVQVLGDLSVGQFTRLMAAMTEWIAPEEGCNYCHVNEGFHLDTLYTKKVARVMTAMTQRVNQDYGDHVGGAGVTCYTCHRGKHVPENVWTTNPGGPHAAGVTTAMQNIASSAAVSTSLPFDPFTPFFEDDKSIRVAGDTALQTGNRNSIKQTEWIYSLMMHFSDSLGVNCTQCHNTRAFYDWDQSSPERVRAWHGIRMVREINTDFINRTTDWLPDHRKGPLGDPLKANCATCHQGAYKPLLGAQMLKDYPTLGSYDEATKTAYLKDDKGE
ncbi:MAG: photosynthetic reaction center cytochrome PufC [Halieaceae bacterium]|jgi:photosynthetic reaction center cytochrome c subunit|nr:photosynthetic reaction center cytochrome PufC [Halieaceae bacterium]